MNALQHHELASIFPMMTEKEMAVLADDIKTNGLQMHEWCRENSE